MRNSINNDKTLENIGNQIRKYRLKKGLSQEELAELADISKSHMSNIENGKKEMSVTILREISIALNVSANKLLNIEESGEVPQWQIDVVKELDDCDAQLRKHLIRMMAYNKEMMLQYRDNYNK